MRRPNYPPRSILETKMPRKAVRSINMHVYIELLREIEVFLKIALGKSNEQHSFKQPKNWRLYVNKRPKKNLLTRRLSEIDLFQSKAWLNYR